MKPYVRRGERVLFAFALVFSVAVYGLVTAGIILSPKAEQRRVYQESPDSGGDQGYYYDENPDESDPESPEEGFPAPEGDLQEQTTFVQEAYYSDDYPPEDDYYTYQGEGDFGPVKSAYNSGRLLGAVLFFYLALIFFVAFGLHILAVGWLMGNGVRVGERQFPELWRIFREAAAELGLKKLPAFYIVQSGGVLNAFATRLFTRNYVAIYSELAEELYDGEAAAVAFVVAHELAHVRRNHALKNLITLPAGIVPFLKPAWRRACEYTCDAGAADLSPTGAEKGLILLAAGRRLAGRTSVEEYLGAFRAERSVWKRLSELFASHPHLPKRIIALRGRAAAEAGYLVDPVRPQSR